MLYSILCAGGLNAFLKEPCKDEISTDTCWFFRREGLCSKNKDQMRLVCTKTCGFCETCEDSYVKEKCNDLKSLGSCLKRPLFMKHVCAATCGFCPKNCSDIYSGCKMLSTFRTCTQFRERMERYCPATCGYCRPKTPCDDYYCPLGFQCQLKENKEPYCECKVACQPDTMVGPICAKNGKTYSNMCALKKAECKARSFIQVDFYGDCNTGGSNCRDEPREAAAGLCLQWKRLGSCVNHARLMEVYCKRTCGFCRVPGNPLKPKCLKTKYGCCWNGKDIAQKGKYGEGCAPCKDRPLCKYFKSFCNSKISHAFMKNNCPITCSYCIPENLLRLKERERVLEQARRQP